MSSRMIIIFHILKLLFIASEVRCEGFFVGLQSSYCQQNDRVVSCDFDHTAMPVNYDVDEDPRNNLFDTVLIRNAHQLNIRVPVCKSLSIFDVDNVNIAERSANCRGNGPGFRIVNSNVNIISRHAYEIFIINSNVGKIDNLLSLKKLSLVNSKIDSLQVKYPIYGEVHVKIENTVIENFKHLKLDKQAHLTMSNATINNLEQNGLVIVDSVANIWNSNIQSTAGAVVIGHNAKLSLKDNSGAIYTSTLNLGDVSSGTTNNYKGHDIKRPPGVPDPEMQKRQPPANHQEKYPKPVIENKDVRPSNTINKIITEDTCPEYSALPWLIPTVVALIETLILILYYCKSPSRQKRKSEGPEEEGFSVQVGSHKTNLPPLYHTGPAATDIRRRPN